MRAPALLTVVPLSTVNTSFRQVIPPELPAPRGAPRPVSCSPGPDGASGGCRTGSSPPIPCGLPRVGVSLQVHLFVFHRPPQTLHEDVVGVSPLPVHADLHPVVLEDLSELQAGELAPLVGVEHFRLAIAQGLLQSFGAKAGFQGVGQPPGHHVPAVSVHDRHQVEEPPGMGR